MMNGANGETAARQDIDDEKIFNDYREVLKHLG